MRILSSISIEDPPSVKAILMYNSDVDVQLELLHLRTVANWAQLILLILYCCHLFLAIILLGHLIMWDMLDWKLFLAFCVIYGLVRAVTKAYENYLQPLYWVKGRINSSQSDEGQ
jgi:hypothetical protein